MSDGFRKRDVENLAQVLATQVEAGRIPGAVFGVTRGRETEIRSVGAAAVGGTAMPPDALFRITSMTRPVTAVATLMLVEQGRLALDEPIDRIVPELAHRQVLRRLDGPLADTVPAQRPVTVRDLLTFRGGFGMILAPPEDYPILQAEADLGLRSVGPPVPATAHRPDEWIRLLGTLPLMDQPGTQWRYSTGSMILGVLIARAADQPLESFYRTAIFEPLGMGDTAFTTPTESSRVVPACYGYDGGTLQPFDDENQWNRPPIFPDAGGGLLSTVQDYLAFAGMLRNGGVHDGAQLLSPDLVALMTTDQLTADQRASGGPILDGRGWGLGLSVLPPPPAPQPGPKGYGWSGGFGTVWLNDPDEDLVAVLCTQVLASEATAAVENDFWTALYAALRSESTPMKQIGPLGGTE